MLFLGVCRPDADPRAYHGWREHTTAWLMYALNGRLFGNGKEDDNHAGGFDQGDRLGVLVDLSVGSLLFFKNGEQHGPGYPAGTLPPVVWVRLLLTIDCLHVDAYT